MVSKRQLQRIESKLNPDDPIKIDVYFDNEDGTISGDGKIYTEEEFEGLTENEKIINLKWED